MFYCSKRTFCRVRISFSDLFESSPDNYKLWIEHVSKLVIHFFYSRFFRKKVIIFLLRGISKAAKASKVRRLAQMRATSSVMTSTEQQDTEQEGFMEIAMAPYESGFEIVSSHSAVAGGNKLNIVSFLFTWTTCPQYIYYL